MANQEKKHIHFIGIAGSLMAPLAVELKKEGFEITGSDKAFYPPASTLLVKNKIKIIPGYKPDKFEKIGRPDMAVISSFLTLNNPEFVYLKEKKVPIFGLGQFIEKYFIKKNSIVVAGHAGKTTTTSLMAWILESAGLDPTILIGGVANNWGSGVKVGQSDWSVTEGDEFKNWHVFKDYKAEKKSRIHYQKPLYAILTGAAWDHYDLYPTKKDYIANFKKFFKEVPAEGIVVANLEGEGVFEALTDCRAQKIYYADKDLTKTSEFLANNDENIFYYADQVKLTQKGSQFEIWKWERMDRELIGKFELPMFGRMNVSNAVAAVALADQLGIADEQIWKALKTFKGIKRRQEIRFEKGNLIVLDDFACSPLEVKNSLSALKEHFPKRKVLLVYQPGNRDPKALAEYQAEHFKDTDQVLLPRVSSIVKRSRLFNKDLFDRLNKFLELKNRVSYFSDDDALLSSVKEKVHGWVGKNQQVVLVFAAQKGFRGLIEESVEIFQR